MKKKWFIYLSIFLSIAWWIGHRLSNPPVMKTVGVMQEPLSNQNNLHYINRMIALDQLSIDPTTTTTSPPRIIRPEVSRSAPLHPHLPSTPPTTVVVAHVAIGGCIGHKMSWNEAHACWDGLIDQYPWDHTKAFEIMYCESTADSSIINSSDHVGLFQETGGSTDPVTNVRTAYYDYYVPRHWSPWVYG